MTDRSWPRRRHRRDRCGPRAPLSRAFPQDGGTRRSGPRCLSGCRLPNCILHRWLPSLSASLLPGFQISRIRRFPHPSDVILGENFSDVVQELPEYRVVGRVPAIVRLLSRPVPDDFRWLAAHRPSLVVPVAPSAPTFVVINEKRRVLVYIIGIIGTVRRYPSRIICAKLLKRRVFANVLGIWQTWGHGRAEQEYPLSPLEGGSGTEGMAVPAGKMARWGPTESRGTAGGGGGGGDDDGEKGSCNYYGPSSRRILRGSTWKAGRKHPRRKHPPPDQRPT